MLATTVLHCAQLMLSAQQDAGVQRFEGTGLTELPDFILLKNDIVIL